MIVLLLLLALACMRYRVDIRSPSIPNNVTNAKCLHGQLYIHGRAASNLEAILNAPSTSVFKEGAQIGDS